MSVHQYAIILAWIGRCGFIFTCTTKTEKRVFSMIIVFYCLLRGNSTIVFYCLLYYGKCAESQYYEAIFWGAKCCCEWSQRRSQAHCLIFQPITLMFQRTKFITIPSMFIHLKFSIFNTIPLWIYKQSFADMFEVSYRFRLA